MVCHSVCDICALGMSSISSMKGVEEVSRWDIILFIGSCYLLCSQAKVIFTSSPLAMPYILKARAHPLSSLSY